MHPIAITAIIVLVIIIAVSLGLAAAIFLRPPHKVVGPVLGTVRQHTKSRIPGLKQAIVQYTRKGRPYTGTTRALPKWMLPKVGVKAPFILCLSDDKHGHRMYWLDNGGKSATKNTG